MKGPALESWEMKRREQYTAWLITSGNMRHKTKISLSTIITLAFDRTHNFDSSANALHLPRETQIYSFRLDSLRSLPHIGTQAPVSAPPLSHVCRAGFTMRSQMLCAQCTATSAEQAQQ